MSWHSLVSYDVKISCPVCYSDLRPQDMLVEDDEVYSPAKVQVLFICWCCSWKQGISVDNYVGVTE